MTYSKTVRKTYSDIMHEWDAVSQKRYSQLSKGTDVTFEMLLKPQMLELCLKKKAERVLDAGCGCGVFTNLLGQHFKQVTGIDISGESIRLAAENESRNNVEYQCISIEEHSEKENERYDLITANMVFMDVVNLSSAITAASNLLTRSGHIVLSITHPHFWPQYAGYSEMDWFTYNEEIAVEGDFRTSSEVLSGLKTTHFHRPLDMYFKAFEEAELHASELIEVFPSDDLMDKYPIQWNGPRYLLISLKKCS